MTGVASSLMLALGQLTERRVLAVLLKSLAVTLVLFVVLGGASLYALYRWLISLGVAYSAELSALAALLFTIIAAWLLFRIVALAVLQFFADEIVTAVEVRFYPEAAGRARKLSMAQELRAGLSGAVRAIVANLAVLPFALAFLFTGLGPALIFWAVNAWLLGRELQDMVWLRHRRDAADPAPVRGTERFLLGGVVAALLALPLVNLLAPILGAAAATHLIHRPRTQRSERT